MTGVDLKQAARAGKAAQAFMDQALQGALAAVQTTHAEASASLRALAEGAVELHGRTSSELIAAARAVVVSSFEVKGNGVRLTEVTMQTSENAYRLYDFGYSGDNDRAAPLPAGRYRAVLFLLPVPGEEPPQ